MVLDGMIETACCPVCQGDCRAQYRVPTINVDAKCFVNLRSCTVCNHRWIDPVPTQENLSYLYSVASKDVMHPTWLHPLHEKQLSNAERLVLQNARRLAGRSGSSRASYLEIGVGGAKLYDEIIRTGLNASGVEPGGWGKRPGVVDSIDKLGSFDFDLIACIDVLEHMVDPVGVVTALRKRATSTATLICRFPAGDSLEARARGAAWPMILPFAHLQFFSKRSAELMLTRAGWRVVSVSRAGRMEFGNALGPGETLRLLCELLGFGDQLLVVGGA